jgi:hypothetical protein
LIDIISFHIVYIASGISESGFYIGLANEFCFAIDGSVSCIDSQGVFFWQAYSVPAFGNTEESGDGAKGWMTEGSYKCLLLTIVAVLVEPPCHVNGMDKMGASQGIVGRHVASVFTKEF